MKNKRIHTSFTLESKTHLQRVVVHWFNNHGRKFPWRKTKNPYHILVAEFLLRRTKADSVVEPYLNFINLFPSILHLSKADVNQLRTWFKPLGLVNRADQMISTANLILNNHNGEVPNNFHELSALPGIGNYIGRAIACLAYEASQPMIDESSGRLLRRLFSLPETGPAYSDSLLLRSAKELLPNNNVREFNLGGFGETLFSTPPRLTL
jgi:A/G-specific adenine glycosylase